MDDHHIVPEDLETEGELSSVCVQIVLICVSLLALDDLRSLEGTHTGQVCHKMEQSMRQQIGETGQFHTFASYNTAEADIISVDAGLGLKGLPASASQVSDCVLKVLALADSTAAGDCTFHSLVDCGPPNIPQPPCRMCVEDSEGVIRMIIHHHSTTLCHAVRTGSVDVDCLFERINLNSAIANVFAHEQSIGTKVHLRVHNASHLVLLIDISCPHTNDVRIGSPFVFFHRASVCQRVSAMSGAQQKSCASWSRAAVQDYWCNWQTESTEGPKAQEARSFSWQHVALGDLQRCRDE